MAASAPVLLNEYGTAYDSNTTPKTVISAVAMQAADVIFATKSVESASLSGIQLSENGAASFALAIEDDVQDYCYVGITAYTVPSNETLTITSAEDGNRWFGSDAFRFNNCDGVGATNKASGTTGTPSVSLTTTQENSGVLVLIGDWSAVDGVNRAWGTVNGYTPSAGNGGEKNYYRDSGGQHYGTYLAFYPNVGSAGAKTFALTGVTGMKWNILAVEVKGKLAVPTFDTKARLPATATFTTANPAVFSITLGASARVLYLGLAYGGTTARGGGAPTYNGITMQQIGVKTNAGGTPEEAAEHWYLLDPPVGSAYNISVPNSGALQMALIAASANAPSGFKFALDAHAETPGNSTNPSGTIACNNPGEIWFAVVGNGAQTWAPTARSGTQLYDWDGGAWGIGGQYKIETTTGNKTSSWTFATTEDWVMMLASFKLVAADITGNLAVTESNDTLAASGAKTFYGTVGVTEGLDTSSISGSMIPKFHTGDVATNEGIDVFAATGGVSFPAISGNMAATEVSDSLAASGFKTFFGNVGITEGYDNASFAGTIIPNFISGSVQAVESADIPAASGDIYTPTISGSLGVVEQNDVLAVSGVKTFYGTVGAVEPNDVVSANGVSTPPHVTGTFAVVEGEDVTTIAGMSSNPGAIVGMLGIVEQNDVVAVEGVKTYYGSLSVTESVDVLVALGSTIPSFISGDMAVAEQEDSAGLSGEVGAGPPVVGTLAVEEEFDVASISGVKTFLGRLGIVEPVDRMEYAGSMIASFVTGILAAQESPDLIFITDKVEFDMGIAVRDSNIGIGISPNEVWKDGAPSWGRDGSSPDKAFPVTIGQTASSDNLNNNQTSRRARLVQAHVFVPAGTDIEPGWYTNVDLQPGQWAWCIHRTQIQNDSDNPIGQGPVVGQVPSGVTIPEQPDTISFTGTVVHPE